jgi:hypothetical protein
MDDLLCLPHGACAALEDALVRPCIRWKGWEERAEPPPCVLDGALWKLGAVLTAAERRIKILRKQQQST